MQILGTRRVSGPSGLLKLSSSSSSSEHPIGYDKDDGYDEACYQWRGPSSRLSARAGGQHDSEETSHRWRAIGDTVFNLTGPGIEPLTFPTDSNVCNNYRANRPTIISKLAYCYRVAHRHQLFDKHG